MGKENKKNVSVEIPTHLLKYLPDYDPVVVDARPAAPAAKVDVTRPSDSSLTRMLLGSRGMGGRGGNWGPIDRPHVSDLASPALATARSRGNVHSPSPEQQVPAGQTPDLPGGAAQSPAMAELQALAQEGVQSGVISAEMLQSIPRTLSLTTRTEGVDEEELNWQRGQLDDAAEARREAGKAIELLASGEKTRMARMETEALKKQQEAEILLAQQRRVHEGAKENFQQAKINPYRYVDNMSTANKVFLAIASGLGEAREAWTQGAMVNKIPGMIQQAIDQDIAVQRANIELLAQKYRFSKSELDELRRDADKWFQQKANAARESYKAAFQGMAAKAETADAQVKFAQAGLALAQGGDKVVHRQVLNPAYGAAVGAMAKGAEKKELTGERLKRMENTASVVRHLNDTIKYLGQFKGKKFRTFGDLFARSPQSDAIKAELTSLTVRLARGYGDVGNISVMEQKMREAALQGEGSLGRFLAGRDINYVIATLSRTARRFSREFHGYAKKYGPGTDKEPGEGFNVAPHVRAALPFIKDYLGDGTSVKGAEPVTKK